MGGTHSHSDETDPVLAMNQRQKRVIKASWAKAMKFKAEVGAGIMTTLFMQYPQYKQMFPFRDVPDSELRQNMKFKLHCSNVVYSLGQIIDNLDNTELVIALLDRMALSHRKHRIPANGFLNIQSIIEDHLRPISNAEEMELWVHLLTIAMTYMTNKMAEGRRYTNPEL